LTDYTEDLYECSVIFQALSWTYHRRKRGRSELGRGRYTEKDKSNQGCQLPNSEAHVNRVASIIWCTDQVPTLRHSIFMNLAYQIATFLTSLLAEHASNSPLWSNLPL